MLSEAQVRGFFDELQAINKVASAEGGLGNAAYEIISHGALMAPAIQHLRGKPMEDRTAHALELGGLGMMTAPYAVQLGRGLLRR